MRVIFTIIAIILNVSVVSAWVTTNEPRGAIYYSLYKMATSPEAKAVGSKIYDFTLKPYQKEIAKGLKKIKCPVDDKSCKSIKDAFKSVKEYSVTI